MAVFKKMFKKFLGFDEEFEADHVFTEQLNNQNSYFKDNEIKTVKEEIKETRNSNIKNLFNQNESIIPENKEIVLYPKSFEDACDVVEKLEKGYVVILNMEEIDIDICKRISDFVLGAIFVLQGDVEKISKKTFRFWTNK
ncbi:MAG: cell division protein SepF [Haloplasmataceae bacterium]|jgi:cell division inhibitor SepF|nr:cell division protein SepF [Haloplasmataceae bacterium]